MNIHRLCMVQIDPCLGRKQNIKGLEPEEHLTNIVLHSVVTLLVLGC